MENIDHYLHSQNTLHSGPYMYISNDFLILLFSIPIIS